MKKYLWLYLLLVAFLVAGFVLSTAYSGAHTKQEVNLIAVNDMIKLTEQHWENPQALSADGFLYRVCIIDNNGQCIWATDPEVADTIQAAIRKGYAILDITVDNRVVGKALIETNPIRDNAEIGQKNAKLVMLAVVMLCGMSLLFLLGLHRSMIRPFQRLESFAHQISTGNFDQPLPMDKNNLFGLFTQSFDVMRASLLEAKHQQAQAERAKKELIASLSHDIKTPVTSIKLIVELLLARNTNAATAEKLTTIEQKTEQINRLLNDLLHSSLEELGELKIAMTSEPSSILGQMLESSNHFGRISIAPIPPCMVDLDVARTEQVIGNILSNAYKYAATDIDVLCFLEDDFLCVEIRDYGSGVSSDAIELLCNKFYRGDNAKESQKEGEGLGLYIAKLLMEKMGGALAVYNRPDGFSVKLMLRLS